MADDRDETDLAPDGYSRIQRACDSCRSRKIRCDRTTPCSNCRASKLVCQTTAPAQKPQRQRVHISEEYERKIDRIEERLTGIESVLESLAISLSNLDLQQTTTSEPSSQSKTGQHSRSPNSSSDVPSSTPAPFEGETTLNTQSEYARELLEFAVGSTPSTGQNTEIKAALASLQDMVSRQNGLGSAKNEPQAFFNKALANVDATKLQRPPWDAVQDVLDKAATHPTMCFAVIFPFLKLQNLKQILREAFDAPEQCPICRRMLVFGVLHQLFYELSSFHGKTDGRMESYKEYGHMCGLQMETAIAQLDMFLPASYENILALVLGVSYAIELCRPSLSWALNSVAIGMCQSLGYHRVSSMKDDTEEDRAAKIHLFWFLYQTDKNLSLRLGRASTIQDWDLSLPYPVVTNIPSPNELLALKGTRMQLYWIKLAEVQGRTYEQLFSPAAFLKSDEERRQHAGEIARALKQAWKDRGEANALDFISTSAAAGASRPGVAMSEPLGTALPSTQQRAPFFHPTEAMASFGASRESTPHAAGPFPHAVADLFYHADVVVYYSTLTLIQRAVTRDSSTFSQDCLHSARASLVAHERCNKQFNVEGNEDLWSGFVHWSVLQSPFTPFIVLICNAITHCDTADFSSLHDFVTSLESCRTFSEGADKLYKMCRLFLQVAKLYIEAKTQEAQGQHSSNSGHAGYYVTADGQHLDLTGVNQFDPYLSALGLVPNSAWPMATYTSISSDNLTAMDSSDQGAHLNTVQDWFSGSRYIMGLMEEDIHMPDFSL